MAGQISRLLAKWHIKAESPFHSFYNMPGFFTAGLFPSFFMRYWLYLLVIVVILLPVWVGRRK